MDDQKAAVLLEDLRAQFRTFGEGLQSLNDKVDQGFETLNNRMDRMEANNHQEHQQLLLMISELNQEVKKLDTEVVQLKRIK
ncbi:MAG: hypothetical protein ACM3YE_10330 [Bacteroidota bacterium]